MLNKQPIFVNSFARGGSNIVWEILQSHPDAAAPIGETDKVLWEEAGVLKGWMNFWLSLRAGYPFPQPQKKDGYWMLNYGFFKAENYTERKLNDFAKDFLDQLLYRWKLKNIDHKYNKYKTENEVYKIEELKNARLVAKHVNGLIFLVPALIEMYPDSIHFGLVRNGLALCESRLRRKTFDDAGKFGMIYNLMVEKFLEYEKKYSNFHILKFEDLLNDPAAFIERIHKLSGLTFDPAMKFRLKAKKFVNSKGEHVSNFEENSKHWVDLSSFLEFVDSDINENQIKSMSVADRQSFLRSAENSMQKLGYI